MFPSFFLLSYFCLFFCLNYSSLPLIFDILKPKICPPDEVFGISLFFILIVFLLVLFSFFLLCLSVIIILIFFFIFRFTSFCPSSYFSYDVFLLLFSFFLCTCFLLLLFFFFLLLHLLIIVLFSQVLFALCLFFLLLLLLFSFHCSSLYDYVVHSVLLFRHSSIISLIISFCFSS